MHKIENIGRNSLYIKATGTLPQSEAEVFVKDFEEKTKDLEKFSVIVDLLDAAFLDLAGFNTLLALLKKDNERLIKSAFVIAQNPPLDAEFKIMLERAASPDRKIVHTLDEAKEWLDISDIIIQ